MTGFLSDNGEFYKCRNMGHGRLAEKIVNNPCLFGTEAEDELLLNRGWIVLTGGYATLDLMHKNIITDSQIEWYLKKITKLTKSQIKDFRNMVSAKRLVGNKQNK